MHYPHGNRLEELHTRYADARLHEAGALVALSAWLFNRPERHDALRSAAPFQQWRSSREQVARVRREIEDLQAVESA
jgi:hypothetical protein